jgi:hypothetical protein
MKPNKMQDQFNKMKKIQQNGEEGHAVEKMVKLMKSYYYNTKRIFFVELGDL